MIFPNLPDYLQPAGSDLRRAHASQAGQVSGSGAGSMLFDEQAIFEATSALRMLLDSILNDEDD